MTEAPPRIPSVTDPGFDAAFEANLNAVYGRLARLTCLMLWDRDRAEDLCQEITFRAWSRRRTFNHERPFEPWVFTIAYRMKADLGRGKAARPQPRQLDAEIATREIETDPLSDPVVRFFSKVAAEDVFRSMHSLTQAERIAIELHFFNSLTYAEAGRILGRPATTVRGLIDRAIKKLKTRLEMDHGGLHD